MNRSRSSNAWLREHVTDTYVQRARADGYRSRASYKLVEMDDRDHLIRAGDVVVDLGASPGGWSQVAVQLVGDNGTVVASDILPMNPIAGVSFIQGDFTEQEVYDRIIETMAGRLADLVISDMAPNMSGMAAMDQPAAMYLVELAFDLARQTLKPGGDFVAKVFHGEGFDEYVQNLKTSFTKVTSRKPDASRSRSREVYIVAKGFKGA